MQLHLSSAMTHNADQGTTGAMCLRFTWSCMLRCNFHTSISTVFWWLVTQRSLLQYGWILWAVMCRASFALLSSCGHWCSSQKYQGDGMEQLDESFVKLVSTTCLCPKCYHPWPILDKLLHSMCAMLLYKAACCFSNVARQFTSPGIWSSDAFGPWTHSISCQLHNMSVQISQTATRQVHNNWSYVAPRSQSSHTWTSGCLNVVGNHVQQRCPYTASLYLSTIWCWWRYVMAYVQALHCDVIIACDHQFLCTATWQQVPKTDKQQTNSTTLFSFGCVIAPDAADVCSHWSATDGVHIFSV